MKTNKPQHTRTPWGVEQIEPMKICSRYGGIIAETSSWWVDTESAKANAAYIVLAVNSHGVLVAGLLELRYRLTMGQDSSGNADINKAEIEFINNILSQAEVK